MENQNCWIQTYSGRKFYPFNPQKKDICWDDIAHALSNICRFTGHCSEFYSVAQHCVLASENVNPNNQLWALLHDAPEAYINDIARPLKIQPQFDFHNSVETGIMNVVCDMAGIPLIMPKEVKLIDKVLLKTEARDLGLMTSDWLSPEWGLCNIEALPKKIEPWAPYRAKQEFLDRFTQLFYFGKF